MATDLLRPDNHDLWAHVRLMAVARDPVLSWEEIAARVGVDSVPELLDWFLAYRLPPAPKKLVGIRRPYDHALGAEFDRLRDREDTLITTTSEAPAQLERVQRRIKSIALSDAIAVGGFPRN